MLEAIALSSKASTRDQLPIVGQEAALLFKPSIVQLQIYDQISRILLLEYTA
jgi:hypothetical protein